MKILGLFIFVSLCALSLYPSPSHMLGSFEDECRFVELSDHEDAPEEPPLRLNGDLNSLQTGSFSTQVQSFTYSLNYSGNVSAAYSIMSSSTYGVKLTVYYSDAGTSHPLIIKNNTIDFLPVAAVRTAYVLVEPLVFRRAYSFSIVATQIANPTSEYDYLVYTPSTHTLTPALYSSTGSSITVNSSSTISYSLNDMGSPTVDGVRQVNGTGYPYSAIAQIAGLSYYNNASHVGGGSGFRIVNGLFGTAAHCLFDHGNWEFCKGATLYVNRHGTNYDTALSLYRYVVPTSYVLGAVDSSMDFGFIIPTSDSSTDYLGFDATETISTNDTVWTVGYPGYDYSDDNMFWSLGDVTSVDGTSGLFYADYPYTGGGSGSAVIKNGKVIGIHVGGVLVGDVRVGSVIHSLTTDFQNLYLTILTNYL